MNAAALLPLLLLPASQDSGDAPPNVLLILVDDLGWMDAGFQGNHRIRTPNLDGLAAQGVRFSDAYAAAPVCSPTRAALLTGLAPARLHITNHAPDRASFAPDDAPLKPPEMHDHLPLERITIAERLREAGYATAFLGKWHLSGSAGPGGLGDRPTAPEQQGFDLNVGGCAHGGPPTFFDPYGIHNVPPRTPGEYLPDRLVDESIAFLDTPRDGPFLLCLWPYAVHWPMEAPAEHIAAYEGQEGPGLKDARYAAMVTALDAALGRLFAALEDRGLAEDTLVIFTSDNGPFLGVNDAAPLRQGKGYLYEGGVRVPLLVRWPGVTAPASVDATPVVSMDLAATVLDAAGLDPAPALDGESLRPLLDGSGGLGRDALFFHYPHYAWHGDNLLGGAVRAGPLKLIERFHDGSVELYDLVGDPGETRDLAPERPRVAAALRARLAAWRARVGAALPTAAAHAASVRVWATGSTEKIERDRRSDLPHLGVYDEATRTVRLSGARGEHVPFQVVVTADHVELEGVTVEVSELQGEGAVLPSERVEVLLEHHVKVYAPTGEHGREGWWPDALVPLTRPFDVRSARRYRGPVLRHQPLWVDVDVPRDQPPGLYHGEVQVRAGGQLLGAIAVELHVADVTMPPQRSFPAQMGFFYGRDIARVHGLEQDSAEFRALWLAYLGFLLEYHCDPTFIDLGVTGSVVDGEYEVEWTDPDLERFLIERGLARVALGVGPPGAPREGVDDEQYHAWVAGYHDQVIAHARENGWEDRLVFLAPVDEPQSAEEYAAVRYWGELLHARHPDVSLAVTEQPLPENPEWGSLVGAVNDWIVHGKLLDENAAAIAERQAAGDRVTWYISCDQLYPQPNYYIDREAADPRMIGWVTWRYRLGGILYWAVTLWREVRDPWGDAISWKRSYCNAPAAGEGTLLYPGNLVEEYTGQADVYGPVASLRLALLREGLEELELLGLLAETDRELADELAASICRDVRDLSRDPVEIDAARARLLLALEGPGR